MLNYDQWFLLFFYLVVINFALGTPLLLLLGLLTPKELTAKYFCVPYYSARELRILGLFPFSLIAHASLAAIFVWPRLGIKRDIQPKGGELNPSYRFAMQLYFWLTIITLPLALLILLGLRFA